MALMREMEVYMNDAQARMALEASLMQMKKENITKMIEEENITIQSDLIAIAKTFDVRSIVHKDTEERMENINTV